MNTESELVDDLKEVREVVSRILKRTGSLGYARALLLSAAADVDLAFHRARVIDGEVKPHDPT